jgi:hypothetical protein
MNKSLDEILAYLMFPGRGKPKDPHKAKAEILKVVAQAEKQATARERARCLRQIKAAKGSVLAEYPNAELQRLKEEPDA